jgi:hypothetical protein
MIYLENDFYSNFNSIAQSNDDVSMKNLLIDQISNLIAFKKESLVDLFGKIGINVSKNPTNKELSNIIAKNLKSNKKLQIGIAYLIAENNNVLQQEMKKNRPTDYTESFEGDKNKEPKQPKVKKPVDSNKIADSVTAIGGSVSVLSDSITQAKTGVLANEILDQANIKSPEQIVIDLENKKIEELKAKKRKRNILIAVVVIGLGITAYIGYKKGWFSKGQSNPS